MDASRFSFPSFAKVVALVALLFGILALLGVAANANLALWGFIILCVAVLLF